MFGAVVVRWWCRLRRCLRHEKVKVLGGGQQDLKKLSEACNDGGLISRVVYTYLVLLISKVSHALCLVNPWIPNHCIWKVGLLNGYGAPSFLVHNLQIDAAQKVLIMLWC